MLRIAQNSKNKELWGNLNLDLPNPHDFIDNSWNSVERDKIVAYLDVGKKIASWLGSSDCRICGRTNGSTDLSDGEYIWPEGFAHYLLQHNVKPPEEFLEYIRNK